MLMTNPISFCIIEIVSIFYYEFDQIVSIEMGYQ